MKDDVVSIFEIVNRLRDNESETQKNKAVVLLFSDASSFYIVIFSLPL